MPDTWKHNVWFWVAATCLVVGAAAQWGPVTIQVLRDGDQETAVRPLDVVRVNPPDLQTAVALPENSLLNRSPVQLSTPEVQGESTASIPTVEPIGVVSLADSAETEGVVRLQSYSLPRNVQGTPSEKPILIAPRTDNQPRSVSLPHIQPRSVSSSTQSAASTNPVRLLGIQPIIE